MDDLDLVQREVCSKGGGSRDRCMYVVLVLWLTREPLCELKHEHMIKHTKQPLVDAEIVA